jgi:hypothetical protein
VEFIFFLLALGMLGIPLVLPIAAWVSARRTRAKLLALEQVIADQRATLDAIGMRLAQIRQDVQPPQAAAASPMPATPPQPAPSAPVSPAPPTPIEKPAPAAAPPPPAPLAAPARVPEPPPAPVSAPAPPPSPKPAVPSTSPPAPKPPVVQIPPAAAPLPAPAAAAAQVPGGPAVKPPSSPPPPPVPPKPPVPPPPAPSFDWEGLVGVKLFSAIAGIALVLAAVFFLKYSIEAGWLQPPVRVAIGVLSAIALLVVCELKAARRYPVTANAMDAAAIAILFATFFAAHALWNLIPSLVTFALLAVVTVVAVLLSIRRESLFIAVLGLLGGFAAPALLSTGENRPIPLFTYLLLLNVGLAWVAYSRGWPVLTWLTLICTVVYQWGWVFKFLDASSLPLAMGIFIMFPLATFVGFILRSRGGASGSSPDRGSFEQSALVSSALPLVFAMYLAAIPAYGAHAGLLLGFLLLIDIGLLAISIVRRQELLHALGAVSTIVVMMVWLAVSYERNGSPTIALAMTSAFVVLYLGAPLIARRFGRPFEGSADRAQFAAPALLMVFPILAAIEPAFVNPWPLVATLVVLVLLVAWRAMTSGVGHLYYLSGFFVVATQAVWSASHLTIERLGTTVMMYTVFGLVTLGVPIAARRQSRPLQPAWGSGAVLLTSLGLLLFLSTGPVAPAALWALALLLGILNAGLFIESAAGRLPLISQVGSVGSWLLLMIWWPRAAGSVGVLPSIAVVVGLTLITLLGHGWAARSVAPAKSGASPETFGHGMYLGLIGHLFLALLASNREWALPPWPIFGALVTVTLGTSVAALLSRMPALHMAGTIAAAVVITVWTAAATQPWGLTVVVASGLVSAYAFLWMAIGRGFGNPKQLGATACAVLFVAEGSLLVSVDRGTLPPFPVLLLAHAVNLGLVLALTARFQWNHVAIGAIAPAWLAVLQWQTRSDLPETWPRLLALSGVLYAIFASYPFALGERGRQSRDPHIAAIVASAMAFFAARAAFVAGGLEWMIGAIPVVEGLVLAILLRALLRLEPPGQRDLGRLALVAGAALAFVTVAIPLQLRQQWITIGWALEGAALAWLYRRIPHRGLLYSSIALLATVFTRLALNPEVFLYEPRGMRVLNWYLYTYLICAASLLVAGWWLSKTDDGLLGKLRASSLLPAAGTILLFLLLNIEIADFYATGPTIMFRFGATVSQDLTYTIGWLIFGMGLLAAGIYMGHRPARVAAVALIAVTTFKCFLYDLGSLEGLHRVASFVGLAISLALVSIALQKFVLSKPRSAA